MGLTSMQIINTSKGSVNVQVSGHGGKALVLIHGNSSSHLSFSKLIKEKILLENYTFYCIDLPGHGKSNHFEKNNYNLEFMACVVQEVITALDLQKFDLLGHSLGGHIALRVAAKVKPQNLILVQCSPGKDLGEVATFFQPLPQFQYLYVENPNSNEVTSLFTALTNSKDEKGLLAQDFQKTDPAFRSGLSESLGSAVFANELDILENLNKAGVQTTLVISRFDQFLKTDEIMQKWSGSELLNYLETKAEGHYAHFADFSTWFQTFKELMVK